MPYTVEANAVAVLKNLSEQCVVAGRFLHYYRSVATAIPEGRTFSFSSNKAWDHPAAYAEGMELSRLFRIVRCRRWAERAVMLHHLENGDCSK